MIKPISLIAISVAVVMAGVPDARADMCFRYAQSGGFSVAQADLPTAPNECISFALYEPGYLLGAGTRTLCTIVGGRFVVLHYTYP
jgi:hypothetical protein